MRTYFAERGRYGYDDNYAGHTLIDEVGGNHERWSALRLFMADPPR